MLINIYGTKTLCTHIMVFCIIQRVKITTAFTHNKMSVYLFKQVKISIYSHTVIFIYSNRNRLQCLLTLWYLFRSKKSFNLYSYYYVSKGKGYNTYSYYFIYTGKDYNIYSYYDIDAVCIPTRQIQPVADFKDDKTLPQLL